MKSHKGQEDSEEKQKMHIKDDKMEDISRGGRNRWNDEI